MPYLNSEVIRTEYLRSEGRASPHKQAERFGSQERIPLADGKLVNDFASWGSSTQALELEMCISIRIANACERVRNKKDRRLPV